MGIRRYTTPGCNIAISAYSPRHTSNSRRPPSGPLPSIYEPLHVSPFHATLGSGSSFASSSVPCPLPQTSAISSQSQPDRPGAAPQPHPIASVLVGIGARILSGSASKHSKRATYIPAKMRTSYQGLSRGPFEVTQTLLPWSSGEPLPCLCQRYLPMISLIKQTCVRTEEIANEEDVVTFACQTLRGLERMGELESM